MTHHPLLSVCMIVKNEAHNLVEALPNFAIFADEMVIVDTGSTDGTRDIARAHTSRLFDFEWIQDFSAARNYSFEKASGRYLLWLDADDRFQPDMQARINRLKAHFDGNKAFNFLLENVHEPGPSSFCYQLRCVPARRDTRFEGRIHEQLLKSAVQAGLELVDTDITVHHMGYANEDVCRAKLKRNLDLLLVELEAGAEGPSTQLFLARTYEALNKREQAIDAMEKAIRRMELEASHRDFIVEGHLFLGRSYAERGEPAKALRSAVRAAALVEKEPHHCLSVAMLFQDLGRHKQALGYLHRVRSNPYRPGWLPSWDLPPEGEILVHMAFSLLCLQQRPDAMEMLRLAWQSGEDAGKSWEWIGLRALRLQDYRLALSAYESALQTGSMSADGYCNLGLIYRKRGLCSKTAECYSRALQLEPGHQAAMTNLAHFYLERDQIQAAGPLFQELVDRGAKELDILLGLAVVAATQSNRGVLTQVQTQLLAADGSNVPVQLSARNPDSAQTFALIAENFEKQHRKRLGDLARAVVRALH